MNLQQRTSALLQVVEAYRARRCAELLEPAGQQAREIRRGALAAARSRVHTAIEEQRKRIATELSAAEARLATQRRLLLQRRAAATLAQAWTQLRAALQARWQVPETRTRWVDSHLDRALHALSHRQWQIHHPRDWPVSETEAVAARLAARGITARFVADPSLDAGVRVNAGNNALDATLDGLLAERAAIEGRLLQRLSEVEA
jgi:vacuolar-type H+-ATPase subunit H